MPLPILSVAQVRDWEKRTWDAGITVESVIEQAGKAVAQLAAQVTQSGDSILLLVTKFQQALFLQPLMHLPARCSPANALP